MKKAWVCATVLLLLTALLAAGEGVPMRSYVKVTPQGVETIHECGDFTIDSQGQVTTNTPPGLVWNYPDNGLYWMGNCVSIGDRGTQICAVMDLNNERAQLFSRFDGNPPVPLWTDTSLLGTNAVNGCDSSSLGDLHVVMYQFDNPDISNRTPVVKCYRSASATPIWTWTYSGTINSGSRVAIDRDATVVAAAVHNNNTGMLELFFLDPATGGLLNTYSQASPGLRGFDLSADGSTLYFHNGVYDVYIFDIASNSVIFSTTTGGSFDGHCISGDGTKFAFGGFGNVKIWEYNGISWTSSTYSTGSGNYADEMDFSDDGTTLGFSVSQYSPAYNKTEGYIMDVATKTIVSHAVWSTSGGYQDVCDGAAISRDGKYFAVARWGDQYNTFPEIQILEYGSNTPVGSIDSRGSAFACDISADGQITVSCGKAVHANQYGNGGDVDCWDLGNEDFVVRGKPRIGQTFQFGIAGTPNWKYFVFRALYDNPLGFALPAGTLYLDIWSGPFYLMYNSVMPPGGAKLDNITLPNLPQLVGLTNYVQVLFFSPDYSQKYLSKDYVAVTVLP